MRWNDIPRKIIIDQDLCIGCLKCIKSCPAEIIIQDNSDNWDKKRPIKITDSNLCFECRACEVFCSVLAIRVMCAVKNFAIP